jgi:hypothetical protein
MRVPSDLLKKLFTDEIQLLVFFISITITFQFKTIAQIPTTCFEIESILVDACVPGGGCNNASSPACNCEGKNEMVRFKVGPNPLNVSNLTVSWPNNSWLGICQNGTTAAHTASLNPELSLENKRRRRMNIVYIHPNPGKPFSSFHSKRYLFSKRISIKE